MYRIWAYIMQAYDIHIVLLMQGMIVVTGGMGFGKVSY